jgi:hypothetical protein
MVIPSFPCVDNIILITQGIPWKFPVAKRRSVLYGNARGSLFPTPEQDMQRSPSPSHMPDQVMTPFPEAE